MDKRLKIFIILISAFLMLALCGCDTFVTVEPDGFASAEVDISPSEMDRLGQLDGETDLFYRGVDGYIAVGNVTLDKNSTIEKDGYVFRKDRVYITKKVIEEAMADNNNVLKNVKNWKNSANCKIRIVMPNVVKTNGEIKGNYVVFRGKKDFYAYTADTVTNFYQDQKAAEIGNKWGYTASEKVGKAKVEYLGIGKEENTCGVLKVTGKATVNGKKSRKTYTKPGRYIVKSGKHKKTFKIVKNAKATEFNFPQFN